MAVGRINILFKANIRQFQSDMRQVRNNMKKFGPEVMRAMKIGATAVAALGVVALKAAAKIETMTVSFKIMLGTMEDAEALMTKLRSFAVKTPFQLDDLAGASRQLIAAKGTTEGLIAELKVLGDIASVTAVPLGDMAKIYTKAMNKGKLQTEELNQLAERGIPIYKEMAKVLGVHVSQVQKMASEGKVGFNHLQEAFKNMTKEGGIAFGAMETSSKTLNGLLSTTKDKWEDVAATIGMKMLPVVNKLLQKMLEAGGTGNIAAIDSALENEQRKLRKTRELLDKGTLFGIGMEAAKEKEIEQEAEVNRLLKERHKILKSLFTNSTADVFTPGGSTIEKGDPKKADSIFGDEKQFTKRMKMLEVGKKARQDLIWGTEKATIKQRLFTIELEKGEPAMNDFGIAMQKVWEDKAELIDFAAQSLSRFASIQSTANDNQTRQLTAQQDLEKSIAESQFASKERLTALDKKHAKEREILADKQAAKLKKITLFQAILGSAMAQINIWSNPLEGEFFARLAKSGVVAGLTGLEIAAISGAGFAQGTSYAPEGLAMVGERGPELVNFKGGEQVFSNGQSKNMMNNGSLMASVSGDEFVVWYKEQARKQNNR